MREVHKRYLTRCDKVQQTEPTEIISNVKGSLYAILFNATEGTSSKDLGLIYKSLTDASIPALNILTLEGNGRTINRFVNFSATGQNLEKSIDIIKNKVNKNDRLLIYITNHGDRQNNQSIFPTFDGNIGEKDYEKIMKNIPVNFVFHYFSQCHSGGFAERIGYENNIGMSNSSKEEKSNEFEGTGCAFTFYLFPNILKKKYSIEKAFDKAVLRNTNLIERITYTETPQLTWQNADPSELCLIQ